MEIPNGLEPGYYLVKIEPGTTDHTSTDSPLNHAVVAGQILDYEEVKTLHLTVQYDPPVAGTAEEPK